MPSSPMPDSWYTPSDQRDRDAWDYVPLVQNYRGLTSGDWGQAALGPAGERFMNWANPQRPYDTAAQYAMNASNRAGAFSNEQWRRQMEGLDRAQGSFGGSNAYWQQAYGNAGPGAMENWYSQYGNKFMNDTRTSGVLGSYQNYMNQPSYATAGYQNAMNYLNGPSSSRGAYDSTAGQLRNPGAAERAYGQQQWTMPGAAEQFGRGPGTGETHFDSVANQLRGNSKANDVYMNYSQALAGPSRSEGFQVDRSRTADVEAYQSQLRSQLGQDGNLDMAAPEVQGYYRGANDVQDFGQRHMGEYDAPGMYENWAQQAIAGTNPAMERLKDQGLARINQEMARRGHFTSGGASTAIGNYLGELSAREYEEKGRLAQGGQQMQLARLGQGQGLAQGMSGEKITQGGALQGLAGQRDQAKLGRDNLAAQIAAEEAAGQRSLMGLELQANQQADQAKLARLMGMQSMGSAADAGVNANLALGLQGSAQAQGLAQNRVNSAQQMEQARMLGQMNAANTSDQQALARLGLNFNMAQGADSADLARGLGTFGMAQGVDQGNLARYGMWGNLAGQEDSNLYRNLMGMGAMAGQAQSSEQQRLRDAFNARFGIDNASANLVGGFYGQGGQLSGQAMDASINAEANAGQLRAQGMQAENQQSEMIGSKVLGAFTGGMGSTMGGGDTSAPVGSTSAPQTLSPDGYAAPQLGQQASTGYGASPYSPQGTAMTGYSPTATPVTGYSPTAFQQASVGYAGSATPAMPISEAAGPQVAIAQARQKNQSGLALSPQEGDAVVRSYLGHGFFSQQQKMQILNQLGLVA